VSLEDMIEEYSKRWKVSKEEAEKEIKKILESAGNPKNNDSSGDEKTPTPENLFPKPIGELSRKVQDINQAALSTAYTRRLLNTPPEDVANLKTKVESLDHMVEALRTNLGEQIKKITEILEDKKQKETREELLKELDAKINPIRENLQKLAEKLEEGERKQVKGETAVAATSAKTPLKPEEVLAEAEKHIEQAKKWLQRQGYKVEPDKLSAAQVQKLIEQAQKEALENLPPDELRKKLEKAGYKIVGGPLTWDQVEKMLEEAKRRAQEEIVDDKRIDAVTNIVRDAVTKIIEMFKPAVQTFFTQPPEGKPPPAPAEEK